MATYLPNITDLPAPIVPFQPDFNFLNYTLQQATQKWELASQQASQIYHTYLEANHINENVRAMRDEYRKKIDSKLTELASHNLTDLRVMKAFRDLVTGISTNPYYMYDLQISNKYDDIMSKKELWAKVTPDKGSNYQIWHSNIEQGMNNMIEYYRKINLTEDNLPLFNFVYNNIIDPVDIDEAAYTNALAAQQFDKLKESTQGDFLVGNTVQFAGPSYGGIQPYIVKQTGGNAIRGYIHDVILKDFQDGNLKRLNDKKALADMFIVGKSYNYDWSKVVEHYRNNYQSRVDLLNNTVQQLEHQAKVDDERSAAILTSIAVGAGQSKTLMDQLTDSVKAQEASMSKESSDLLYRTINIINGLMYDNTQKIKAADKNKNSKDIGTAMMAAKIFHQTEGLNNVLNLTNKWVDAHTRTDIEYNKAFGDMLDYLIAKEKLAAQKSENQTVLSRMDSLFTNNQIKLVINSNEKPYDVQAIAASDKNGAKMVYGDIYGKLIPRDSLNPNTKAIISSLGNKFNSDDIKNSLKTSLPVFSFVKDDEVVHVFMSQGAMSLLGITASPSGYLGTMNVSDFNKLTEQKQYSPVLEAFEAPNNK